MKPITEGYVNECLKSATETLIPHKAEELWEQPVEKAKGDEWYLDGVRPKKRCTGQNIRAISSLAACLAVCFLSFYMVHLRVDTTVFLDVNPSIALQVNCNEKVIRVQANNPDGEIVLENMDLKNADLNVAVNAVIGSMVRHGYLTEARDVVLLSVSSGSAEKTESLRVRLSGEINDCLTSMVGSSAVFNQEVELDDDLVDLAEKYGITPGKAALIRRVVEAHPGMDYDTLARLSMKKLTEYLTKSDVDIRNYANYTGAPFESSDRDDDFDPKDVPDDADEPDDMDSDDVDEEDDFDSGDADELEDDD